jgi:hypothetical protein
LVLSTIQRSAANDGDDDDVTPRHAYSMIHDGDDDDDDANEVDHLFSILDVAMHTGMNEPF